MTLPTNDDFANRELSIEELETIAAGSFWSWVGHELGTGLHYALVGAAWLMQHTPPVVVYNLINNNSTINRAQIR
jgi:hypothetical protein